MTDWIFCYPYGRYNDTLLAALRAKGCAVAVTVKNAIAPNRHRRPGCPASDRHERSDARAGRLVSIFFRVTVDRSPMELALSCLHKKR